MQALWKQTGIRPQAFDLPELPQWLEDIWKTFLEFHAHRTVGAHMVNSISYPEMVAYQELHNRRIGWFERMGIELLDSIYLEKLSQRMKRIQERGNNKSNAL